MLRRCGTVMRSVIVLLASPAFAFVPPVLHSRSLDGLFGTKHFAAVKDFLHPSLVRALALDVTSLRCRLTPELAAAEHGRVEWLVLQPEEPPRADTDDALGVEARHCLLRFVGELQQHIEERTGVALDAHCELKYAYYPCGGSYQRHVDGMNMGSVHREYSFLLYLNEGWSVSDGGHLRVFNHIEDGSYVDIAPAAGTLVVFKSDVVPQCVQTSRFRLVHMPFV